jgi:hypothetical protein
MEIDTLNISNLVLMTVPTIANKNIKKICMENAMYLLSLMIENVNFFYKISTFFIWTVNRKCQLFVYILSMSQKSFLRLQKKL